MKINGAGGLDLQQHWDGDPRAYLGITIPGFPNLFCLYGPNTNIVVNGSIVVLLGVRGALRPGLHQAPARARRRGARLQARRARRVQRVIDAGNLRMAWGAANVPTWYKNDKGRVTQNWPFDLLEFWTQTRAANPDDYVPAMNLTERAARAVSRRGLRGGAEGPRRWRDRAHPRAREGDRARRAPAGREVERDARHPLREEAAAACPRIPSARSGRS